MVSDNSSFVTDLGLGIGGVGGGGDLPLLGTKDACFLRLEGKNRERESEKQV